MKEIKNFRDIPLYKECPFTEDSLTVSDKTKSVVVATRSAALTDTETGELFMGKTLKTIYRKYDNEKFLKVYFDNIRMMFDLSRTALNVLVFSFSRMKPNTTEIFFTIEEVQEYCGYKHYKSAHDGITELINRDIIARGHMKVNYFINPAFVFNGDRLRIVKEYHVAPIGMTGDIVDGNKVIVFGGIQKNYDK